MHIQVNTDNNIDGHEGLANAARALIEESLGRFAHQITRVEVHLGDENSHKGGKDKRCMIEARLQGRRPVAVTHQAGNLDLAVRGAAGKLERAIERSLGRLRDR